MPSELKDSTAVAAPVAAKFDGGELLKFNLDDIRTHGFFAKLIEWILLRPLWLMALLRRFFPIVKLSFFNCFVVTRYDDVQELLSQDRVFDVPWKQYIKDLNDGRTFLLGMDANDEYWKMQRAVMEVFRHEDVEEIVRPLSERFARHLVESSNGSLEAIEGLISRVPTLLCEEYFGVPVAEENPGDDRDFDEQRRDFAYWLIAMSTFTFGNPSNDVRYRKAAMAAGQRVRALVGRRIAEAKARPDPGKHILGRLINVQRQNPKAIDDITIRTWLISMMTGFVPTCTLASGRALWVLMRRPDFLRHCQEAARADNDDLLRRCIRETMRFMPIFVGHQRICRRNYILAEGTPRAREIPAGEHVIASTWSAMFDSARIVDPYAFNPDRPASNYMLFGVGVHSCLGVVIAEEQILQTMKALLRRRNLGRADSPKGRMEWLGQFPGKLWVKFDA